MERDRWQRVPEMLRVWLVVRDSLSYGISRNENLIYRLGINERPGIPNATRHGLWAILKHRDNQRTIDSVLYTYSRVHASIYIYLRSTFQWNHTKLHDSMINLIIPVKLPMWKIHFELAKLYLRSCQKRQNQRGTNQFIVYSLHIKKMIIN